MYSIPYIFAFLVYLFFCFEKKKLASGVSATFPKPVVFHIKFKAVNDIEEVIPEVFV